VTIPCIEPTLFPTETIPYLIVAPKYTDKSAGVRVLHLLCHALNRMGQRAYITIYPQLVMDRGQESHICPDLCTPLMTQEILDYYEDRGRAPIVVYPETINNPLRASRVVRYVLNYPGLLGGAKTYPANEIIYAYSRRIAKTMNVGEERVLFLPVSDPTIFSPPLQETKRSGTCFYASKYRDFHKGKLFPVTDDSFEITVNRPDSLTKPQIAELFRRSELFYTYEDTALAIEAGLCGCPAVFLPNDYLKDPLGFDDLGMDGFAWGNAPEEIARAKASVGNFRNNYQQLIDRYWQQLELFVGQTQKAAQSNAYAATPIRLPSANLSDTIYFVSSYIRQHGMQRFFQKAKNLLRQLGMGPLVSNTLRNCLGR
jgi:hypothetical protein